MLYTTRRQGETPRAPVRACVLDARPHHPLTRTQERFHSEADYDAVKTSFELCPADLVRSRAIVMHPLPRVNEITPAVDLLPNARYFEQVGYGVVMRMTLLGLALRGGL